MATPTGYSQAKLSWPVPLPGLNSKLCKLTCRSPLASSALSSNRCAQPGPERAHHKHQNFRSGVPWRGYPPHTPASPLEEGGAKQEHGRPKGRPKGSPDTGTTTTPLRELNIRGPPRDSQAYPWNERGGRELGAGVPHLSLVSNRCESKRVTQTSREAPRRQLRSHTCAAYASLSPSDPIFPSPPRKPNQKSATAAQR